MLGPDGDEPEKVSAAQTGEKKSKPAVFYCHGPECWLSTNAPLRAIESGYKQVY